RRTSPRPRPSRAQAPGPALALSYQAVNSDAPSRGERRGVLELLSSSGFAYGLIAALVAADGVFPAVPGETALIGGALLASDGKLSIAGVIVAGIVGGWIGDNASYLLGSRLGRPLARAIAKSERAQRRIAWARDQLEERGGEVIISIRFVPVGR